MEADELIRSWSSSPFSEYVDPSTAIEACTKKMGNRLSGVYGVAISPDLLAGYGWEAGHWFMDQMVGRWAFGTAFGYGLSMVGKTLKRVYHDHANGKEPPKPEEFRMLLSGAIIPVSGGEATLTATRKDT
jgi:hypothetical protein